MYEDNRRFSWTNLFIKMIIVVIFILFTIWLLQFSIKNGTSSLADSLNVLTDGIFSENVEKMKEVGKSYFTTERLPGKVGEVKTLTLSKMYDENLILELKDKNGNACSAKNSYVTIEKMENEYQMKVYLECGEVHDFIKVIMGCYNYCDKDICEKKEEVAPVNNNLEYEYSKTSGGYWTQYGAWSEWSKVTVDKTNYRDVETKTVKESYTYDKEVVETKYMGEASCPSLDGYTLTKSENGVCTYNKTLSVTSNPVSCDKEYQNYKLVSQNGFVCNYSKQTKLTSNPALCDKEYQNYKLVSQNGFTCNYSRSIPDTKKAFTSGGDPIYGESCSTVVVGYEPTRPCTGCGTAMVPIYGTSCSTTITGYTPVTYSCPVGYTRSGDSCTKTITSTTTTTVGCPSGYVKNNNTCVKLGTSTTTTTVGCPSGYVKKDNICVRTTSSSTTRNAVCGNDEKMTNGKCYKDIKTTQRVTEDRDVTYYRYRIREYVNGTTDYKWSTSNNDKKLLDAGYKLTGKTRNIGGK